MNEINFEKTIKLPAMDKKIRDHVINGIVEGLKSAAKYEFFSKTESLYSKESIENFFSDNSNYEVIVDNESITLKAKFIK